MKNKKIFALAVITLSIKNVYAEKSPDQVVNESWGRVCQGAKIGSNLQAWCMESPTETVNGVFNSSTSSGIGNSTVYSDRLTNQSLEKREEELKKKQGGGAGDILSFERLGFYATGKSAEDERKTTTLESGYESDMHGFTVGADYFFADNFVAGLAVDYMDTKLNFDNQNPARVQAGSSNYETLSVLGYGNYRWNKNLSIDGYLGWSGVDYDILRPVTCIGVQNAVASGHTTADKILAGMTVNYSVYVEGFSVTPSIKADYSGTFIDSFRETGGQGYDFDYQDQEVHSFKTNLGFDVAYNVSVPWGVLIPRVKAGYIHEFLYHQRTIKASFVDDASSYTLKFDTDKPDRDYFIVGGGVSSVLTHNVQMYVDYERIEGHRYLNSYVVTGGVRLAF
jgi:outer membrane lipase/esterase